MSRHFKIVMCFIILNTLKQVSSQEPCVVKSVYYVSSRTGADSEDCLRPDQRDHPCASLSYLKDNIHQCATMKIIDDLLLNNTVILLNSSYNIEVVGEMISGLVTVNCIGNSGIRIDGVVNISLDSFLFIGCAFSLPDYEISPYPHGKFVFTSILVINASEVVISNCVFNEHSSYSILLTEVHGSTSIENCSFDGNGTIDSVNGPRVRGIVIRQNEPIMDSLIKISSCIFTSNINKNINYSTCYELTKKEIPQTHGGAVNIIRWSNPNSLRNVTIVFEHCVFESNEATNGGAISVYFYNYAYMLIVNSTFINNRATCDGGAVFFLFTDYLLGNSTEYYRGKLQIVGSWLTNNSAYSGGALEVKSGVLCGDICYHNYVDVFNSSFTNNTASGDGFAISLMGPDMRIIDGVDTFFLTSQFLNCLFEHNLGSNNSRGAVYAENSLLIFSSGSSVKFVSNTGTALVLLNSRSVLGSNMTFIAANNSGTFGGAVFLDGNSDFDINSESHVLFAGNRAAILGGAIYSKVYSRCTFGNITNTTSAVFNNNLVGLLEQSICIESIGACGNNNKLFLTSFTYNPPAPSAVLFPLYAFNVTLEPINHELMLGQIFHLNPQGMQDIFGRSAIGMGYLSIKSTGSYEIQGSYEILGPKTISLDNYTKDIEFIIVGPSVEKNISLDIEIVYERNAPYGINKKEIQVTLVPCRLGYEYCITSKMCMCENISHHNTMCIPNSQSLCVKREYWYSTNDSTVYLCPTQRCIFLDNQCPNATCSHSAGYCHLNGPDDVCRLGRSGFLCSKCADGYSFTFAGLCCTSSSTCSTGFTLLLLLLLMGYWMLTSVVIICLSLKWNVGSGYMYGLIHFFSVATMYTGSSELLGKVWMQALMAIGRAVMTLDPALLGYFDICFLEKWENPLSHELFQLMTPVAVTFSVSCLIVVSHICKSKRKLSLSGKFTTHSIFLLTLFTQTAVSYTSFKLLTPLKVKGRLVVQIAPAVPYFGKEHEPYAILAILAELLLSLPVCCLLLLAPLISKCIDLSKWKVGLLLEEFQRCYKPEYRWFAGFYFSARQVIFFINATSAGPFPNFNNILTTVNILILFIHIFAQPYSKKWLNVLDTFLLLDIIIMSLLTPFKADIDKTVNSFVFNILIPYSLILFPVVFLIGGFTLAILSKLCVTCRFNLYKNKESNPSISIQKVLSTNKQTSVYLNDNFNETYREPLLEELDNDDPKETTMSYGSLFHRHT